MRTRSGFSFCVGGGKRRKTTRVYKAGKNAPNTRFPTRHPRWLNLTLSESTSISSNTDSRSTSCRCTSRKSTPNLVADHSKRCCRHSSRPSAALALLDDQIRQRARGRESERQLFPLLI